MTKPTAYLVGAGPGDLGLVTLRARQLIERAAVLIYDYLCNPEILRWASPAAEIIYAGKQGAQHTMTQGEINSLIVDRTRDGRVVVRLKGGDPFVFGRGGEEAEELIAAGLSFEIVPGVTSAIAAPAYAGIPITHRSHASSVTFLTGHEDPDKETSSLNWKALAADQGTRVILMGVERLANICKELIAHGAEGETPCALIRWGTYPRQRTLIGSLSTISGLAEDNKFKAPAIFVIGTVVELRKQLNWFESRPLFGRRIVVTRTRSQASTLSEQLQVLGAEVLEIPTIRIVPREWPEIYDIDTFATNFDWLIFTSPNAVDLFFTRMMNRLGDIRKIGPVKIATVGPATSAKVKAYGLKVEKQPQKFTTEELSRCFEPADCFGQRFCLVRGNLADLTLHRHLTVAGAHVEEWTIYDTLPETEDRTGARKRFCEEGADWITFTSSSTVENWQALQLIPPAGIISPRYASMGPVTSATMRKLGYDIHAEADESTIAGLVEIILREEAAKVLPPIGME